MNDKRLQEIRDWLHYERADRRSGNELWKRVCLGIVQELLQETERLRAFTRKLGLEE